MKVVIIYSQYYDIEKERLQIGGVETYITNLRKILIDRNLELIIITRSVQKYRIKLDDQCQVIGTGSYKNKYLYKTAKRICSSNDLLIFGTCFFAKRMNICRTLSIQHGLHWDIESVHGLKRIPGWFSTILRCIQTEIEIYNEHTVNKMVCVDYNYINWYRSQTIDRTLNYTVITNFADTSFFVANHQNKHKIKIIFARRLEVIRGTDLLCEALPEILEKYEDVSLTIAGEGSQKGKVENRFKKYKNVNFTVYEGCESIQFHSNYDIAIVPTIGSEGTSLSLLEAMAAKCAVVCTDVGGMSNIVLDKYNGRIIRPNKEDLINILNELVNDYQQRIFLSEKARETVENSFSLNNWKKQWNQVFDEFSA